MIESSMLWTSSMAALKELSTFLFVGEEGVGALSWLLVALKLSSKLMAKLFKGMDGAWWESSVSGLSSTLESGREGLV